MKSRLLAVLSVSLLAAALTVQAQPPAAPSTPGAKEPTPENLTRLTDRGAREYKEFEAALLRLVQRMEARAARGSVEDRDKAAALRKAIDLANKEQIENRFAKLLGTILAEKQLTTDELTRAAGQNEELIKVLREMLEILLTDSDLLRKKEEALKLQELIKQVDAIIKAEKIAQTKMDGKRVASEAIAKEQEKITKNTESVARSMGAKKDEKKPDENDPMKGDPMKGDPMKGDPMKGDPMKGDPMKGDPMKGDPMKGDPMKGDPMKGDPMKGDPMKGDPMKGDPKPSQQPPPPSPASEQAKKQIQDAIEGQKKVEDDLKKDKRDDASKKTDDVIKNLEDLKKELEKRLKQLREEELERLLANLQARCEKMLAMQIEVHAGTKRVHAVVLTLPERTMTRAEEQQSQALSTREGEIVKEANRTLNLMSSEGSAVAFAMSLENVRDDMMNIEKRLDKYDVGQFTQNMEEDVINALKDMIEALKKKQEEMKDQKNNPKPPPPPGQPPPQRLLDLIAELKLIKTQQVAVNKRTQDYARHYEGEQTDDPLLIQELENLAKRQAKLEDMLKKIATGKNQ